MGSRALTSQYCASVLYQHIGLSARFGTLCIHVFDGLRTPDAVSLVLLVGIATHNGKSLNDEGASYLRRVD